MGLYSNPSTLTQQPGNEAFPLSSHNSQGMRLASLKVWRLC